MPIHAFPGQHRVSDNCWRVFARGFSSLTQEGVSDPSASPLSRNVALSLLYRIGFAPDLSAEYVRIIAQ